MIIKDLMSAKFRILRPGDSFHFALQAFAETTSGILPVVNNDGILIGILTKNRLIRTLSKDSNFEKPIEPFILNNPICIKPDYTVEQTRHLLLTHSIAHAPVVDEKQRPIGIISTSHILYSYQVLFDMINSQLKLLLDNLQFGLFSVNKNKNLTAINPFARTILQLHISNKTFEQILLQNPQIYQSIDYAISERRESPKKKVKINGYSLLLQCYPLFDKEDLIGAMIIMEDLTNIEKIISDLRIAREWEEKLRTVLEIAYDAVVLVNDQGIITMVNKGFCDLFSTNESEIIGKSIYEIPDLDLKDVIQLGTPIQGISRKIGSWQCLISVFPVKNGSQLIGYVCKIMYRGLKQLQEALDKVSILEKKVSIYEKELHTIKGTKYSFSDIIGESTSIRRVKKEAFAASQSRSTVLLIGESGTGKELFAHGIHVASTVTGPFVKVNCAAIPEELLEAEFFGYEEGAFTGAKKGGKKGKFELAQNGTLFLDEIGDMPLSLQSKILRVLQEKEFEPLGSNRTIQVNTRIIAATNKNLEELVKIGKFREDLYFRLNILRINIPPLRARKEDIPLIIKFLIDRLKKEGFYLKGITPQALTAIMEYDWPGNVRELQNVLERAANLTTNGYIDIEQIPNEILNNLTYFSKDNLLKDDEQTAKSKFTSLDYRMYVNQKEKELIIKALKEANGNKKRASEILGISRTWLYTKLKKYEIL